MNGAEVHLVDLARWIAEAIGAPRHPRAVGRTLAVAIAHPDRDATLPRPSPLRWILAAMVLAAGVAASVGLARPRLAAAWPVVAIAALLAVHGVPTLSHRATLLVLSIASALPVGLALLSGIRTPSSGERTAVATLAGATGLVVAVAILAGVVGAAVGGPPARVPTWTAVLDAVATILVVGGAVTGAFLVGTAGWRVRSGGRPRPPFGQ